MAVKWLTCTFGTVETASGEVVDQIRFDPDEKRTRVVTARRDKAKMRGVLKDKGSAFGSPMTIVFDAAKSRARLLPPTIPPPNNEVSVAVGSVNVQRASWLFPGALQISVIFTVAARTSEESSFVANVVIFPARTTGGDFAAMANVFIDLGMIVMSARCTANAGNEIRPDVERIRSELESLAVKP